MSLICTGPDCFFCASNLKKKVKHHTRLALACHVQAARAFSKAGQPLFPSAQFLAGPCAIKMSVSRGILRLGGWQWNGRMMKVSISKRVSSSMQHGRETRCESPTTAKQVQWGTKEHHSPPLRKQTKGSLGPVPIFEECTSIFRIEHISSISICISDDNICVYNIKPPPSAQEIGCDSPGMQRCTCSNYASKAIEAVQTKMRNHTPHCFLNECIIWGSWLGLGISVAVELHWLLCKLRIWSKYGLPSGQGQKKSVPKTFHHVWLGFVMLPGHLIISTITFTSSWASYTNICYNIVKWTHIQAKKTYTNTFILIIKYCLHKNSEKSKAQVSQVDLHTKRVRWKMPPKDSQMLSVRQL